ncbi:uncharacterized protein LOC122002412 isoform X2 [Zingiber officinale]|uniref:Uncharacterized protein n=1 Tax=Zingiber officinale TaxID=94328 RepID=A0A8J5FRE1_ZINOF|nr:uncharacterized protein LOC122002412 isoform X2 [Zingiber officinale]KAG6493826.1 hypothetical protein ZIOFF_048829 [Zingiber officinale]
MEQIASVLDGIKGFVQTSERFFKDAFQSQFDAHRKNPIEILKRLQRETFSDLMKLRDRQDKVERVLSSFVSSKGSPFQESSTQLKGTINLGGALPFQNDQQVHDSLDSLGINTGIDARFIFKTNLREKDALLAELVAHQKNSMHFDNEFTGISLVLSKIMYHASVSDLLSVILVPFGATCNDFRSNTDQPQGECLNGLSLSRPPLFNLRHAYGVGLSVKASNFAASFGELISGWNTQMDPASQTNKLSSFLQISSQYFGETKLSLSGVWQMPCSFSKSLRFGRLACGSSSVKKAVSSLSGKQVLRSTGGSISMLLDIDESSKFGGWVEVQKSSSDLLNWAVFFSDVLERDIGFGVTVGGNRKAQSSSVILETFLNFCVDKRAIVQPALVLTFNERRRAAPALVFRTSWSM